MCKRLIKLFLWMGAALAVLLCIINLIVVGVARERILSADALPKTPFDCIIVPGARVYEDGTPCVVLRDRLDEGVALYKAGVSDRLLLSGDHSTTAYDEVTAMKQYALEQGVREEDIFLDHAGFSTYETMYRAAEVYGAKSCVVVTQRYHLFRALFLARRMGMEAYGVSTDRRTYARMAYYELREALARVKDFAFTFIKPKPTYLGTPIPLTGDGRLTALAPFALPIWTQGNP